MANRLLLTIALSILCIFYLDPIDAFDAQQKIVAKKYFNSCYEITAESDLPSGLKRIPTRIRFLSSKMPKGYVSCRLVWPEDYILQPLTERDGMKDCLARWYVDTNGQLIIYWGLEAIKIELKPIGSNLQGLIYIEADVIDPSNPPQTFQLKAVKIQCP